MKNFFDAFISYGRADSKAFATKLNEQLTAQGFNVWFDQNDIPLAVDFQEQINDGIEKAHNFLFIIAPHSVNSPYCLKEIELAIKHNKRIIPLLHVEQINQEIWQERNSNKTEDDWKEYQAKGLHSSFDNMHPTIGKINWVYFREKEDNFETSLTGLVEAIQKNADYVQQHTQYLIQGLEWQKNQQQTNYLLVGEERHEAEAWLKRRFTDQQPPCIPTDLQCEFISESTKNANNLLTQVFLAYSDKDEGIKEKIRKTLMREGLTIWRNKTDIKTGSAFQEAINQGLEGADNFVYLLSADSLESPYCQQELAHAFANNKRIIPLLIDGNLENPSTLREEEIPPTPLEKGGNNWTELYNQLKELQFIDFTGHEDADKYQIAVDKLLAEIKKDPSYYEKHKTLLVKALKWQRQNRNPSLLLQGYNLQQFEAWFKVAQKRNDYPPLPLQEEFITASLNKPEEASLEVFISYSRTDSDLARKLNDNLQELGKTTWFDQESIATGSDFQQEIYRGIESSDNFLFIISPKSVNSPYCASEVEYAQKLNKRFVTILYRPLSAKDKQKLPPALASVQWLDFNQHGGEFAANFNELVRTLDTDRDHVRSHTEWSQKALKWQKRDQDEDLLLRGSELAIAENWLSEADKNNKQPPATELQQQFIEASGELRDRIKQAEVARRRRDIRTAWGIAAGSLVAVVVSSLLGFRALIGERNSLINQARASQQSAQANLRLNQSLDGMVESLQAAKALQHPLVQNRLLQLFGSTKRLQDKIESTLQWAVYRVKETNRMIEDSRDSSMIVRSIVSPTNSPNEQIIAIAGEDGSIKLWDLQGKKLASWQGDNKRVWSLAFSPDNQILASSGEDGTVRLWDLQGKQLKELPGHKSQARFVTFSRDGKRIASVGGQDGILRLWNREGNSFTAWQADDMKFLKTVDFHPNNQPLVTAGKEGNIKIWNLDGKLLKQLDFHAWGAFFSPDGKYIAAAGDNGYISVWESQNVLWDSDDQIDKKQWQAHEGPIWNVAFSPNSQQIASGGDDGSVRIWDLKGQQLAEFKGHIGPIRSVKFTADGKHLVSSGDDGTTRLWNFSTQPLDNQDSDSSKEREEKIDKDCKKMARKILDKDKFIDFNDCVFSPDGKLFASAGHGSAGYKEKKDGKGNNKIIVWNLETGEKLNTFQDHVGPVLKINFSSDSKRLVSAGDDKTIRVWEKVNEKNKGKYSAIFQVYEEGIPSAWKDSNDEYKITAVIFSPDVKRIISSDNNGYIRFWDLKQKQQTAIWKTHRSAINDLDFSSNEVLLATVGKELTIRLPIESFEELRSKSCDIVSDYLKNKPEKDSDRDLCDGIGTQK